MYVNFMTSATKIPPKIEAHPKRRVFTAPCYSNGALLPSYGVRSFLHKCIGLVTLSVLTIIIHFLCHTILFT